MSLARLNIRQYNFGWPSGGVDAPPSARAQRIEAIHEGLPLRAVTFAGDSHLDQCLLLPNGSYSDAEHCGVKNPWVAPIQDPRKRMNWIVKPAQFFTSAPSNTQLGSTSNNWCAGASGSLEADAKALADRMYPPTVPINGVDVGHMGALLSLNVWYGELPPFFSLRRDAIQIARTFDMTSSEVVRFRQVTTGRDAWELSSITVPSDGTFTWTIYGITDNGTNRRATALATGGRADLIVYQGSRGYDAIELHAGYDSGDEPTSKTISFRFTARDW